METNLTLKAAIDALAANGGFQAGKSLPLLLWLANHPENQWSPKQKYAAWKILSLYIERLAALGFPYADLPVPPNPFQVTTAEMPPMLLDSRRVIGVAEGERFYLAFPYNSQVILAIHQILPSATWGGRVDPNDKRWYVPASLDNIPLLRRFARQAGFTILPEVEAKEQDLHKAREQSALSRLKGALGIQADTDANLARLLEGFGTPDLKLFPFQERAVSYALKHKRFFLSLPMGAGKTIVALAALHAANAFPALVICPASPKYNWAREVMRWLPNKSVWVLTGNGLILQDADVIIVNYDLLHRYEEDLKAFGFKAIIADECHRLKNEKARRTRITSSLINGTELRMFLSGTPLINRPAELISQLKMLGRMQELGGQKYYEKMFCGASTTVVKTEKDGKEKNKWIKQFHWDKLGGSERNRRERVLNDMLKRTCMFRLSLEEILPDLPKPKPIMFPVTLSNWDEYKRADEEFLAWIRETKGDEAAEKMQSVERLAKMNYLRQLAGIGKIEAAKTWLRDFLADTEEKTLVFVDNVAVGVAIANEFQVPFLWGGTPASQRTAMVDRFQTDPKLRVMVMSSAGQESLTLTAARHIAFIQYYWTPAAHDQGISRSYGRVNDPHSVNVYFFYGEDTIDAEMVGILDAKRETVETVLDGKVREELLSGSIVKEVFAKYEQRAFQERPQKGLQA